MNVRWRIKIRDTHVQNAISLFFPEILEYQGYLKAIVNIYKDQQKLVHLPLYGQQRPNNLKKLV